MVTQYVKALFPTPVFNHAHFPMIFSGTRLPLDEERLFRGLGFIAFPQTLFKVLDEKQNVLCVETKEYVDVKQLYIDRRFVQSVHSPNEREILLLSSDEIIGHLESLVGTSYVWGGNFHEGIKEWLKYYPFPKSCIDPIQKRSWFFEGVDCSGLLYQVTNGATPRNTSELINYGSPVSIERKPFEECVQPLDLIVWKGHMLIVLDKGRVIESKRELGGVVIHTLSQRISSLINDEKRLPANDWSSIDGKRFVTRRWI